MDVTVGAWVGRGTSQSPTRLIVLDVYLVPVRVAQPIANTPEHDETRWVRAADLDDLDWASADVPIVPLVQFHLEGT